ncbi:hypothetical protein K402DRAFT_393262 [Aulographum hederae CBS 113979]|uniref:HAD-like protein n=1 Tax=Aulographum hederae CBS 113979 TaxID=1176131 RepID=A0A6G1H218_9PEZI|nr:hypothetical protein K402DRAFT_393262 [Aulographum hederae CBS 113979]
MRTTQTLRSTQPRTPRNLLLCFDAFGTLFTPRSSVPLQYIQLGRHHGINVSEAELKKSFSSAFKSASSAHPNYGKNSGLAPKEWWSNVIRNTFTPFLGHPRKTVPTDLIRDLLHRFCSREGYELYPDILPFFQRLREYKTNSRALAEAQKDGTWPFTNTVVGVITNSDDRVPGVLRSLGLTVSPLSIMRTEVGKENLGDDVAFTVLSYDAGVEKPHPDIFRRASELFESTLHMRTRDHVEKPDLSSYEKVYVGDDLEKDMFGAVDSGEGWKGVLMDRTGSLNEEGETFGPVDERLVKRVQDGRETEMNVMVVRDLRGWKGP